ncbi:PQQ-binding-like beta-propeller repeat protein [Methanosarcina sp. UBA5]|uniref:outer membrane protein assembly factor BamB family protein n=1 Tax=Methanosarcina sp. UBA5 TaxID=1915593 RepID=UPI0025EBD572|nr:PQQ-binding-like beta-propeller repeat protein [Methanosarcina sp. UBA5]
MVKQHVSLILASVFVIMTACSAIAVGQNWTMVNYDDSMSRHSNQTQIGKDNVNQLEVKWILNTGSVIEDSPLIIGKTGYVQNNKYQVIAFDINTGLNKWKYDPEVKSPSQSHGIAYDNEVIYAPTGPNGTVIALNAENGRKIWESSALQPLGGSFVLTSPPLVWKDCIILGSAFGDVVLQGAPATKGTVTALNKKTGKIVWQINTTAGDWVKGKNASTNGGATVWSGGAIDTQKGIVYLPCGNPAPDFDASSRPGENLYSNNVIAVNITTGKILWATPFVAAGTVINTTIPDTHDWDTCWGTNLATINSSKGPEKIVIGHNKRGDIMAMDSSTGKPIWWTNVAYLYRTDVPAMPNGSGAVWPSPSGGVMAYSAFDENTVYVAVTNQGMNFFSRPGEGHVEPAFDSMTNGIGNGSITALDLKTGEVKWNHKTDLPTWVSPLVTNGVVFSGTITAVGNEVTGVTYPFGDYGAPTETSLITSGILRAYDAETGKELWKFNVGAPIGIGGPSIGNGILLVPTGNIAEVANSGGYIVAFELPEE